MRYSALLSNLNLTTLPNLFNRKSHFGNQNTVCDRISKEAVRELKLKEETYHAISHINQYCCRESELLSRLQFRQGAGVYQALSQRQETDFTGAGSRKSGRIDEVICILNRLAGAMNNAQNGISFLEVQDGMLETVGKIIDRMSELKGLASQDPMKSKMDTFSYNNEFRIFKSSSIYHKRTTLME